MTRRESIQESYENLSSYHNSLPHPIANFRGDKTLSDGTTIITQHYELGYKPTLSVSVSLGEFESYFELNEQGLTKISIDKLSITLESILNPRINERNNLYLYYRGRDVDGYPEERFKSASIPLVGWVIEIDKADKITSIPVSIRGEINTYTSSRRLERLLKRSNPEFRIDNHIS